ncbi:MAG: glycosyltransferase family 2 protein [Bacteroidota bacterium]
MPRILAVVVLYFPSRPLEHIVESFKSHVDDILVVDNTQNNTGVAAALNLGLKKALEEHYDWCLTMDQDSFFEKGALEKLKNIAFEADEKVGMISPFHKTQKSEKNVRGTIDEVRFTMSSGCLVRINTIGYFEEKLFIDSVDTEYCLRLRKNGYKIIRVNDAVLDHELGTLKKNWLGFSTIVHPASRRYYITRNMLYIMSLYPEIRMFGIKELIKAFVLIVIAENDKPEKIKAFFRGFRDFREIKNAKL